MRRHFANLVCKPLQERFEAQYITEPNSGCWLWVGAVDREGYGQIRDNYACKKAHRVSYELHKDKIPDGHQIDHLCRVTSCVNPDHLEIVTARENKRRGLQGVLKTHCKRGHPLSGDNLLLWREQRLCRACRTEKWLKTPARQRRTSNRRYLFVLPMGS